MEMISMDKILKYLILILIIFLYEDKLTRVRYSVDLRGVFCNYHVTQSYMIIDKQDLIYRRLYLQPRHLYCIATVQSFVGRNYPNCSSRAATPSALLRAWINLCPSGACTGTN